MANVAGRKLALKLGASSSEVLVGDTTDLTVTYNGVPIDVTNQGADGMTTFIDGIQDSGGWVVAGNFTYNTDTTFLTAENAATSGTHIPGMVEWIGSGTATDKSIQCDTWAVSGLSYTGGATGASTVSMTLSSSGDVTYTAAADS